MLCKKCEWTANKYFQLFEPNFIRFVITFHCVCWVSEKCCLDSFTGWQLLLLTWKNYYIYGFIFHVKFVRKIMQIFSSGLFNLCSLYKCCISYICCIAAKFAGYVNNSPKNLYTKFRLFVCFTLTPGLFPIWNNGNNLCKLIHISRSFWKKKLVLGR